MTAAPETSALIKSFEELHLKAVKTSSGDWVIGYGHRSNKVCFGMEITEEAAEQLLAEDIERTGLAVERLLLTRPSMELTPFMLGALVSFAHEMGLKKLEQSVLLQRVNSRDYISAIAEFAKHNHNGGRELRTMTRRRAAEAKLFCSFPTALAA